VQRTAGEFRDTTDFLAQHYKFAMKFDVFSTIGFYISLQTYVIYKESNGLAHSVDANSGAVPVVT
jgi:hypothetical protein